MDGQTDRQTENRQTDRQTDSQQTDGQIVRARAHARAGAPRVAGDGAISISLAGASPDGWDGWTHAQVHYVSLATALRILNRPVTRAVPDWGGAGGLRWNVVNSPIANTTADETRVEIIYI